MKKGKDYLLLMVILIMLINSCEKKQEEPIPLHDGSSDNNDYLVPNDLQKYVLPFPIGKSYFVSQAFNSSLSHFGIFAYSIDFDMSIGTIITAARDGIVVWIAEYHHDADKGMGNENIVIIKHEDETYSRYIHLTYNGAIVNLGDTVTVGDTIALSGNSGLSDHPHLHFDVTKGCMNSNCQTVEFYFKDLNGKLVENGQYYSRK